MPPVAVWFDSVECQVIHWDPPLMAALGARGARFPDFLPRLDVYIGRMDQVSDARVREDYRNLRHFYFDQVRDERRERAFRSRLERAR